MYRIDVMNPDRIDPGLRQAWINLARECGLTTPLLHPDFAILMGRVRKDVRIVCAFEGGRLVAVLPLHRRPGGLARPLGAPFADIQGMIAAPDFAMPLSALFDKAGIRALHFDAAADPQGRLGDLAEAEPLHLMRVNDDLDAVLENQRAQHAKRYKNHRRLARQLERERGHVELVAPDRDAAAFDTLIGWKRAQFERTGRHDVLAPRWAGEMMRTLFLEAQGEAEGLMVTLRVEGQVAAGLYGIRTGSDYNPWIAAFDPDFAPWSPGQLILHALMEKMPDLGLTRVDLAGGHDHYKKYYANAHETMRAGMVTASGLARARTDLVRLPWSLGEAMPGAVSRQVARLHRRTELIASSELDWRGRVGGLWRAVSMRSSTV
ncbi:MULTISPECIES: GNAT family N-acetyltransferase [Hyphobacterium]|uniref:GNAT family N-acetyltransferase n=1 Tax=Hyphobacterium vulgare TaxID=1736751 RepID=A0ABV6ZXH2_9PROT